MVGRSAVAGLLFALAAVTAHGAEYPAAELDRFARYVKEPRQEDLSFIKGKSGPGVVVRCQKRRHWTDWIFERDRWSVALRVPLPPDELTSGQKYVVPLEMRIYREGDDALELTAKAAVRGVAAARVELVPGRVVKSERRADRAVATQGQLAFTPRLDWDADPIGVEVSFATNDGTEYVVARYWWWSNRRGQVPRNVPRRRGLDPSPP